MKNLLFLCVLVLFFATLQSCVEEQAAPSPATVNTHFSFPVQQLGNTDLPNSSVNISITNQDGAAVLTDRAMSFVVSNGVATTESVTLPPGDYRITKLALSDGQDKSVNVIYGLQEEISSTGGLSFSITEKRNVTIDINGLKPKGAKKFQLAVYTNEAGNKALTTATAYLMDGATVLRSYPLDAKLNKLSFDLDPLATYTLVIVKKGFARIANDFVYDQIGHKPLKYVLTTGMTMLAIPSVGSDNLFSFIVEASSGTLEVNWGDGTTETHSFSAADNSHDFNKEYATSNPYYVTVTGDVDQITYFYAFYGNGTIHEADFYALTGLEEVRIGLTEGPAVIDFTNNSNLRKLLMPGILNMEQLLLPPSHQINDINIAGQNMMSPAAVDAVIANIHNNAIANSIHNGEFNLSIDWGDSESGIFVGPPSATGFTNLAYLRDSMGWLISPSF